MVSIRKSAWLLIAICFISSCSFSVRPNPELQLFAMASALGALTSFVVLAIRSAKSWRARGLVNLLSCLLLALSFPIAAFLGQAIRSMIFACNMDRWNQAAAWVMAHNKPNSETPIELPTQYSDLAYGVQYKTDISCGIMLDFLWGDGFPVKHTVRRYATDPNWLNMKQCRAGWARGRRLSGNWYEISD